MMFFVVFTHKINCTSTKIASKLDALLLVCTIFAEDRLHLANIIKCFNAITH